MVSPQHSGIALYLRLLRHIRPYWKMFAGALLAMAVTAAAEPAIPALFKPLLDEGAQFGLARRVI